MVLSAVSSPSSPPTGGPLDDDVIRLPDVVDEELGTRGKAILMSYVAWKYANVETQKKWINKQKFIFRLSIEVSRISLGIIARISALKKYKYKDNYKHKNKAVEQTATMFVHISIASTEWDTS